MIPFARQSLPVLGPTPEFVRWSVDQICPIRKPIGATLAEKTERYLWSLAEVGRSLSQGEVVDGVAIKIPDSDRQPARGFFVGEVADFYGGLTFCQNQCGVCPANIGEQSGEGGQSPVKSLAGCFGWLIRNEDLVRRFDDWVIDHRQEYLASGVFRSTQPAWYGFWTVDKLEGKALEIADKIFDRVSDKLVAPADWRRFHEAIVECRSNGWSLSVQFVPAGHASETDWTIEPYCPDCRAPMPPGIRRCESCGRGGNGHPARRRKLIGQRPFTPLEALVGSTRATQLLAKLAEGKVESIASSKLAKTNL